MPTKGADECAVAEIKNDVICSGFTEVLSSGRTTSRRFWALKESAATALKLAGVNVKMEESALYDSQSNGLAESAVKDAKDAVRTNLACLVRRFGQEFPGGHTVPTWLVKYFVAMVNRCRRGPDGKTACELRKDSSSREHCRILRRKSSSWSLESRKVWRESNRDGRIESSLVCLAGATSCTLAQREASTRFEQSDVLRPQNELTSRF